MELFEYRDILTGKFKNETEEGLKNQPHFIHMQGTTSTSESFRIALDFAKTANPNLQPALFVTVIHNYWGFRGFRMNSELYTAHPEEKEILLAEGAKVAVLGVDDVLIDNAWTGDPFWKDWNGKTISVVYLFHAR